jgi:hypothetical protein
MPRCSKHPETELQCPRCIASKGGKSTARKHADQLKKWGKKGGRALAKKKRAVAAKPKRRAAKKLKS